MKKTIHGNPKTGSQMKPVNEVRGLFGLFGAVFSDARSDDGDNILQDGKRMRFDANGKPIR